MSHKNPPHPQKIADDLSHLTLGGKTTVLLLDIDDNVLDSSGPITSVKDKGFGIHGKHVLGTSENAWDVYDAITRSEGKVLPKELMFLFALLNYQRHFEPNRFNEAMQRLHNCAVTLRNPSLAGEFSIAKVTVLEVKQDIYKSFAEAEGMHKEFMRRSYDLARKIFYDIPYEALLFKGIPEKLATFREFAKIWVYTGGETKMTFAERCAVGFEKMPINKAGHQEVKLSKILPALGIRSWSNVHVSNNKIKDADAIIARAFTLKATRIILADDDPKVGKAILQSIGKYYGLQKRPIEFIFIRSLQGKNALEPTNISDESIMKRFPHISVVKSEVSDLTRFDMNMLRKRNELLERAPKRTRC